MAYPEINGFSLQDINGTGFIVSNIKKFNTPERIIDTEIVSRRPGVRLLNDEFRTRRIVIDGYIMANSPSDLQSKIDAFNIRVMGLQTGQLAIEGGRVAEAIVESANYDENPYNTDFIPYTLNLLLTDPFFYGEQLTADFVLASGTNSFTVSTTISGSYKVNPNIIISTTGSSGETLIRRVNIEYSSTGEVITWSGGSDNPLLDYSDVLTFDFNQQLITRNSQSQNTKGVFADFDPGERNFIITFSGTGAWPGGTGSLSYQPRYL